MEFCQLAGGFLARFLRIEPLLEEFLQVIECIEERAGCTQQHAWQVVKSRRGERQGDLVNRDACDPVKFQPVNGLVMISPSKP